MATYSLGSRVRLLVGAFGEVSTQARDLTALVACDLSTEHLALFDIAKNESKGVFTQRALRSIGLALHYGWTKLLLVRCRDLIEDPRQTRTHKRLN